MHAARLLPSWYRLHRVGVKNRKRRQLRECRANPEGCRAEAVPQGDGQRRDDGATVRPVVHRQVVGMELAQAPSRPGVQL